MMKNVKKNARNTQFPQKLNINNFEQFLHFHPVYLKFLKNNKSLEHLDVLLPFFLFKGF